MHRAVSISYYYAYLIVLAAVRDYSLDTWTGAMFGNKEKYRLVFFPFSLVISFRSFYRRSVLQLLNYESLPLFTLIYRYTNPLDTSLRNLRLLFLFL